MKTDAQTPTVSWTGQVIECIQNGKEYVRCAVCKSDNFIGLQSNAWYDSNVKTEDSNGKYVHYGCLSKERLAEIAKETEQELSKQRSTC